MEFLTVDSDNIACPSECTCSEVPDTWRWRRRWKRSEWSSCDMGSSVNEGRCNFRMRRRSSGQDDELGQVLQMASRRRQQRCRRKWNVTFANFIQLVIMSMLFYVCIVDAFPTSDCDWMGSGTRDSVVQTVYLRCQRGQITWERPRGGLRVNISPPSYFRPVSGDTPFRLCLESTEGTAFRVFLEQTGSTARKLLPFISSDKEKSDSNCYRISTSTATLYVESTVQHFQSESQSSVRPLETTEGVMSRTNRNEDRDVVTVSHAHQQQPVKISYEIELTKSQSLSRLGDDECRPCSDEEILQLYCSADVVARGEILSVKSSQVRKNWDNVFVKSDLVIHQNHQVFQPLKPGSKNLQKFLGQEASLFDEGSPKKAMNSKGVSKSFVGIVQHPTKCAAQTGPGEFLWLINLSFARPKVGCVIYWDKWTVLAKAATENDLAGCPFVY